MTTNSKNSALRTRLGAVAALLTIGLLLAASSARAVTFDFTSDHCTGGCGTPPFGTVTLTQSGTSVDITVHLLDSNTWANTASTDNELFKFNDATISLSDILVTQTFAGETLEAQTGTFNGDGTGDFSFGIACTTCKNGATGISSDIVFTVNNTTIADLTQGNNLGIIFVADILSGTTGNTGPVDVTGGGNNAPDSGSTALLLGLGLIGLGWVRVPFRKKA
ncbi:MAG: hypothetical protein DME45_01260 [Verrucomicrobia bacterium]|nr:MAG: hypothetical protein DME45_01260 [Verrucomicrobiota bacterium]